MAVRPEDLAVGVRETMPDDEEEKISTVGELKAWLNRISSTQQRTQFNYWIASSVPLLNGHGTDACNPTVAASTFRSFWHSRPAAIKSVAITSLRCRNVMTHCQRLSAPSKQAVVTFFIALQLHPHVQDCWSSLLREPDTVFSFPKTVQWAAGGGQSHDSLGKGRPATYSQEASLLEWTEVCLAYLVLDKSDDGPEMALPFHRIVHTDHLLWQRRIAPSVSKSRFSKTGYTSCSHRYLSTSASLSHQNPSSAQSTTSSILSSNGSKWSPSLADH